MTDWIVMADDFRLHIVYDKETEEDAVRVFEKVSGQKAVAIAEYKLGKTIRMKPLVKREPG